MKRLRFVAAVVFSTFIACSLVSTGYAQQAAASGAAVSPAMLKITVVLTRVNGDKKIASLPFVLMVTKGQPTQVQMSSEVPIPTYTDGKSGYTYRSIGTSMSAYGNQMDGGLYDIGLSISDSQMLVTESTSNGPGRVQNFTSTPHLLLRDGGTVQYAAATDKATGDVIKVDVTLNVIK
jgi:hypothetical protein